MRPDKRIIPILIFIGVLLIYFFTSAGNTPYNYFTRLADAFLQGKYWLSQNPPWLSELIPAGVGKYYVVYPPLPAILALPFVAVFGPTFPQQYLAHILGAGIVVLTYRLSLLIKKDVKLAIWSSLLVGLGSIVWYLSATGSSWYLGQVSACFFLSAALVEALNKKRGLLIGILLGASYLSRINTILAVPFLAVIAQKNIKFSKNILLLGLGLLPFILGNAFYNYLRFGVFWDQAYFLLPKILNELNAPWFSRGVMNIYYIPSNLKVAFWSFPIILHHFPYLQPSWAGQAIWLTTPAFVYAFLSPLKTRLTLISWGAATTMFLFTALHGGTGFAQFGYRFAVDFYPLLILLTILGVARQNGPKWHHWLLLIIGIIINLWGVLWINKFGWVSF